MDQPRRHPKLEALHALWASRRPEGRLPARADFDVIELAPWLGNLNVVEVIDGGRDFRYRLHGTNLVRILGMELTGRRVSELPAAMQGTILDEHRQVLAGREPCWFTRIRFNRDEDHLRVAKLALPLAADGHSIDRLLLGLYLDE